MRKFAKVVLTILFALVGALVLAAVAGLSYRAYRQQLAAQILSIHSPNAIDEGRFVSIGGINQWIRIRGEDRDNPVLLFVHGGPGGTTIPISSGWRAWEKDFTVVQWDQRGTGRTYGASRTDLAPTMTLERMTQDGIELAEYLRTYLRKDRIILVGHSWGSFLAIHIARRRPDLFYAYVGTGQVVGRATFEASFQLAVAHLMVLARAADNRDALAELTPVDADPVITADHWRIVEKWSRALKLPSIESFNLVGPVPPPFMPDFTLVDWWDWFAGMRFSAKFLRGKDGPMFQQSLDAMGYDFALPVIFIEGDEDYNTPMAPAQDYFNRIAAPGKAFVQIHGGDHFLPFDRPDAFLTALLERVRPLADETSGHRPCAPHPAAP